MSSSEPRFRFARAVAALVSAGLVLGGCATASKDVATSYVSPLQYQSYDCEQLAAEAARIQARVTPLGGRLDTAADNDKALTGVGLILFWPALFFLGGTKDQEAEYGRLKGEFDAVGQASIAKKCAMPAPSMPSAASSAPTAAASSASAPTQADSRRAAN